MSGESVGATPVPPWYSGLRAGVGLGVRAAPVALASLIMLTLAAAAVPVTAAWLTKLVLDRLAAGATSWSAVAVVAISLVATGLVGSIQPLVAGYLQAEFGRRTSLVAQDRLYQVVNGFGGLRRFEDPAFLDQLRMAQQVGLDAPGQVIAAILGVARSAMTAAGFVVALALISPYMALIVLLGAVPIVVAELRLARTRLGTTLRTTPLERRELFYAGLLGDVRAAKEIRLFGTGAHLRERMRACRVSINELRRRMDLRTAATQGGLTGISAAVAAVGLLWAVRTATTGAITIGDVSMFIVAVGAVQSSVGGLAFGVAACHQHLLVLGHYLAITQAGPDLPVAGAGPAVPRLRKGIEFCDVWFRYSPEQPWVLRGVSFTIPFGQSVAIVGANGAGKSTMVKLLCRFYDPTRGAIRWDGVDITTVPVDELRSRISAIFQDFVQYDMTAAENIALGDLDAATDRATIEAAATLAGIHDKLAGLPRGYDTMLSRSFVNFGDDPADQSDGAQLSGGQWQRVALARALLRDQRDLLILDEPSSGLDAVADHEIHTRLRWHRAGQTGLLISHRMGAVRTAATIVVLDGGRVVERGSHDELVASNGIYARTFTLQAQGYVSRLAQPRQSTAA